MDLKKPQRGLFGSPLRGIYTRPLPRPSRWARELERSVLDGLKFSGIRFANLSVSVDPNTDVLAPVRTVTWYFSVYGQSAPQISGTQRQFGPHSNQDTLTAIARQFRAHKFSRLIRFRFWLYRTWGKLTTEVE